MKTLAFANQKGGVAKTTSTFTIGNILASLDPESKILMIDFDPQGSLSVACGIDQLTLAKSMYDVITEGAAIKDILVNVCNKENLYLAPSTIDLSSSELSLVTQMSRETVLRNKITELGTEFDYVLIDCSPSLSLLTINALTAADKLIIPCSADYLAYKGLTLLIDTVNKIKTLTNPNIEVAGVITTLYNSRTLHCKEVLEILEEEYQVLGVVGVSTQVKDAMLDSLSIYDVNKKHPISQSYLKIVKEII